jgi:hypothetical protein
LQVHSSWTRQSSVAGPPRRTTGGMSGQREKEREGEGERGRVVEGRWRRIGFSPSPHPPRPPPPSPKLPRRGLNCVAGSSATQLPPLSPKPIVPVRLVPYASALPRRSLQSLARPIPPRPRGDDAAGHVRSVLGATPLLDSRVHPSHLLRHACRPLHVRLAAAAAAEAAAAVAAVTRERHRFHTDDCRNTAEMVTVGSEISVGCVRHAPATRTPVGTRPYPQSGRETIYVLGTQPTNLQKRNIKENIVDDKANP